MNRSVKLALLILLWIPLGILLITGCAILTGGVEDAPSGIAGISAGVGPLLLKGLLGAFAMIAIFIPIDIFGMRNVPPAYRNQGVKQTRVIVTKGAEEQVYSACKSALRAIRGLKIKGEDLAIGKLSAKTGMSFCSNGEKIEVAVKRLKARQLGVTVTSRPIIPTVMIDMGKNCRNVETFVRELRSVKGVKILSVKPPRKSS